MQKIVKIGQYTPVSKINIIEELNNEILTYEAAKKKEQEIEQRIKEEANKIKNILNCPDIKKIDDIIVLMNTNTKEGNRQIAWYKFNKWKKLIKNL